MYYFKDILFFKCLSFVKKIVNHDSCGENISCLNRIQEAKPSVSPVFTFLQTFSISFGHNKLILTTPINVKKGQMVGIWFNSPIAIDTTNNFLNSDYNSEYLRLNYRFNWRFYVNALIKDYYFINYFYFNQSFGLEHSAIKQTQNITAKYLTSNFSVARRFDITKSIFNLINFFALNFLILFF